MSKKINRFNKAWLDLLLEHKDNMNVSFKLSENDTRILLTYIEVLQQKNKQLKEVIEEVRALHKKFCTKHGIIVFENNELIEFMNNLIDTLNKAKDNK